MEYKITMADVCELAHQLTESECIEKDILILRDYLQGEDETYTAEAQQIYDKYYNLITNTLAI